MDEIAIQSLCALVIFLQCITTWLIVYLWKNWMGLKQGMDDVWEIINETDNKFVILQNQLYDKIDESDIDNTQLRTAIEDLQRKVSAATANINALSDDRSVVEAKYIEKRLKNLENFLHSIPTVKDYMDRNYDGMMKEEKPKEKIPSEPKEKPKLQFDLKPKLESKEESKR